MLWNGLLRGEESTGIYSPKNNIVKSTEIVYKFLKKQEIKEDNFLIGHVRSATYGTVIKNNAHPFNEGNVVLAHNGTLSNYIDLLRKYNLKWAKFDVDSHVVCGSLNEAQNFEPLGEIDGPAAFLIADKNTPNILYVFRNTHRPLYYGFIDKSMYISSIEESLEYIDCKDIKQFAIDSLYTIKDGVIKSQKAITNTPYKEPVAVKNNTTSDKPKILQNLFHFKGTWVLSNHSRQMRGNNPRYRGCITHNKWYFVDDYMHKDDELVIKDDEDNISHLGILSFNWRQSYLRAGFPVMLLDDIVTRGKTKIDVFKNAEIATIIKTDFVRKAVLIRSKIDKEQYWVGTDLVRRLNLYEDNKYLEQLIIEDEKAKDSALAKSVKQAISRETENNSSLFPVLVETTDENENLTKDIITNGPNLDEDDISMNTDEEEEDANFYNLEINDKMLAEALDIQNDFSENLLEFIKDLPQDKQKKYKDTIHKMQSHLMVVSEQFNITDDLLEK